MIATNDECCKAEMIDGTANGTKSWDEFSTTTLAHVMVITLKPNEATIQNVN